jgi:uncharacterized HAD superfamily protein
MKPRLGIDIDGVIRDIYTPLLSQLSYYFPKKRWPPIEEWTNYEIWKTLKVSKEWLLTRWFDDWANTIYLLGALPYEFAKEDLALLKELYQIVLISAQPNKHTIDLTIQWLERFEIPYDELHFTTYETKSMVQVDLMVEDSPYQIDHIYLHGYPASTSLKRIQIYLMDRPWNQNIVGLLDNVEGTRIKRLSEVRF